jgi:UDP-N-acetylglucosamine 4-epimerase
MKKYAEEFFSKIILDIKKKPRTWLITGVAGFVGSNLLEYLLNIDQKVVGIDNFITGYKSNLEDVKLSVTLKKWKNFKFIKGDICNFKDCEKVLFKVDHVLHQAALGSVPRSIHSPINTHNQNVNGFLNMLIAAKNFNVKSFVYASSSSVYGDHPLLPKEEDKIGRLLSPYAATKFINEIYSDVFHKVYNFKSIGLRYFNVFGKRQDPNGSYAAVIPKWINLMIQNKKVTIYGDGNTSRDFCYIENVIRANILASLSKNKLKYGVYNIAAGKRTSLNQLFVIICKYICLNLNKYSLKPTRLKFRDGDIRHSQANISSAKKFLNYFPSNYLKESIRITVDWYISALKKNAK